MTDGDVSMWQSVDHALTTGELPNDIEAGWPRLYPICVFL